MIGPLPAVTATRALVETTLRAHRERMVGEYGGQRRHSLRHNQQDDRRPDHELNALGSHGKHVRNADLANPIALRARILAIRRALLRRRRPSGRVSA
jgi:hypothetical protein